MLITSHVDYKTRHAIILVVFLIALCFSACGKDVEYKPVDFSKTIDAVPPQSDPGNVKPLRVAVAAMTSPRENFAAYQDLLDYLGKKLGRNIRLVQRKTYGEINSLFAKGGLDLAFICTGPYVTGKDRFGFEGLVTPLINGTPYYQAYLIVNVKSPYKSLNDLKGHTFAFTDPDSNTGTTVPRYWLAKMKEVPESFFSDIVYTYSHDNSIKAVANSMVDGASIDGAIWEFYNLNNPAYTRRTKIIKKSVLFGAPPLVVAKALPKAIKGRIRNILTHMDADSEGKKILNALMIDAFRDTDDSCYASARQMYRELGLAGEKEHAEVHH
ncbi:MAG: phosphate/phosphite/phosphonate ABC transporter substrate-binding protein [Deltaproteobacteria bacterium]|nr:phosphate/phosphite/phosphonate ABC transporter substrate-binding protein [Deltaproteobacteria bacterium]